MYPEDRVLVAYVPRKSDFDLVQKESWYRIPAQHAPKGIYAEYVAFYFGKAFGTEKWAIHYYAQNRGHELVRRVDLLPNEPNHPRAHEPYYKIQLGPIETLPEPILSLQWRRLLFIHTTWDRFRSAREVNDLMLDGDDWVNRKFSTLHEKRPSRYGPNLA